MTQVHESGATRLRYAVHPLLFGIAPVLYLYSQNLGELGIVAIARPLAVVVGVLLLVLLLLNRSMYFDRIVVLLSTAIVLTFSYAFTKDSATQLLSGPLRFLLEGRVAQPLPIVLARYDGVISSGVLLFVFALVCCTVYFKGVPRTAHDFLIVMSGTMVAISVGRISLNAWTTERGSPDLIAQVNRPERMQLERARLPDIFYIVPDRYGSGPVLRTHFDFDNHDFLAALGDRGFYVADSASANYLKTGHSLAASLNMQYINRLSDSYGPNTGNWHPVFDLVSDNEVQRLLRLLGYRYVHLGSWWPPTAVNRHADVNFPGRREILSPLEQLLFDATPAKAFLSRYRRWRGESTNTPECERVHRQLAFLRDLRQEDKPVFAFTHFLVPHTPMRFDSNGNCIDGANPRGSWESYKQAYVEQVKFINAALLDLFDALRGSSTRDLVFIIQSDEGPFPRSYHLWADELDWEQAERDDIVMKFGIINALYFPDQDYRDLNPRLSPVNNFRIVLNRFFGTELPLLEDRSYIHKDGTHIFRFTDVTEILSQGNGDRSSSGLAP